MGGDATVLQVDTLTGDAVQAALDALDAQSGGGVVRLGPGVFEVRRTLRIGDDTTIEGAGAGATVLALAPGSSQHLLTNRGGHDGNRGIHLRRLSLLGRAGEQPTPPGHERYPFSCGALLHSVTDVTVTDVVARDIRATAFHFDGCRGVRVVDVETHGVGWSGVSTTCTDDIEVRGLVATDSGRDNKHSSIHLDGGVGALVEARVEGATGTGVMLEAAAGSLEHVVVRASATGCAIGFSASSVDPSVLHHVHVTGSFNANREAGVRIANAAWITVAGAEITGNGTHGVLFQGARGGRRCVVAGCTIEGNPIAVEEHDASGDNLVVSNSHQRSPTTGERARASVGRVGRRARRAVSGVVRRLRPDRA